MATLHQSASVVVACEPGALYDIVSDVTRMGEWSPVCRACWWDEGDGPRVGAWFTGRNELPDRTWKTRSEVVATETGAEFSFVVSSTGTRWRYEFTPVEGGTQLTESWHFPPSAVPLFEQWFGDDAEAQVAERSELARTGFPATLAAIKRAAESA